MYLDDGSVKLALNQISALCHKANIRWWLDLQQPCCACFGKPDEDLPCEFCSGLKYARKDRNVGELLMLCVSELTEALEGHRKGLYDDKLPQRSMFEVEIADCFIRLFDLSAGLGLDLGSAFVEKMSYNAQRRDHTIAARLQDGGKAY